MILMKSVLMLPGHTILKSRYGGPLSNFAFNFKLRRYNLGACLLTKRRPAQRWMKWNVCYKNVGRRLRSVPRRCFFLLRFFDSKARWR